MKNTITTILLFFAAISTSTLIAQTPGPVHGKGTDQEIQKEDEQSEDRTYKQTEREEKAPHSHGKRKQADQRTAADGGQTGHGVCNNQKAVKTHQRRGKQAAAYGKNMKKEEIKQTMNGRRDQMKKGEHTFKHHPIFERRADARNGKGEGGRG